jgi:transcriptional regulator with XRE-family HTH domain
MKNNNHYCKMISYEDLNIHYKIKKIREMKNFTREFVAGKLEIEPRTYSYIEEGKGNLTLKRMIQICNVFNCTIQELLDFNVNKVLNFNVKLENGNQGNNINYQEVNNEKELYMALIKAKDDLIDQLRTDINQLRVIS